MTAKESINTLTFTPMYAAYCLGEKLFIFYPAIFRSLLNTGITCAISAFIANVFIVNSWIKLILCGVLVCIIVFAGGMIIVLNKDERNILLGKLKTIISKVKG